MKKVLITGGAGFIGYHLASSLSEQPCELTIIDNLSRGEQDPELLRIIKKKNVNFINCDLTEEKSFELLKENFDNIYHLAAINGTANFYERPEEVLRVNILSLLHLLNWLNGDNCKKLLFASSSEAYAGTIKSIENYHHYIPTGEDIPLSIDDIFNPRNSYGGSKIIGELLTVNYCRKKDVPFIIVRYHNIYGPRMGYDHVIPQFCQRVFEKADPFTVYGGRETRSFCYVDDGVRASRLLMAEKNCNNLVFNIGDDREEIEMVDLAGRLIELGGYTPAVEIKPAPEGSVKRRCPDLSRLSACTAYRPEISLQEGLEKTYHWYLNKFKEAGHS